MEMGCRASSTTEVLYVYQLKSFIINYLTQNPGVDIPDKDEIKYVKNFKV